LNRHVILLLIIILLIVLLLVILIILIIILTLVVIRELVVLIGIEDRYSVSETRTMDTKSHTSQSSLRVTQQMDWAVSCEDERVAQRTYTGDVEPPDSANVTGLENW
jgi:hypothetical protein